MTPQDLQNTERLSFSKNWNNKLLCFIFITIRPISKKYKKNKIVDVRIVDAFFCYAKLIDKKELTIKEIIESNYNLIDSGLSEKYFFEFMEKMYSKSSWWNGIDSKMNVLFFEKIVQLEMF